jgi:hypothetical protein
MTARASIAARAKAAAKQASKVARAKTIAKARAVVRWLDKPREVEMVLPAPGPGRAARVCFAGLFLHEGIMFLERETRRRN